MDNNKPSDIDKFREMFRHWGLPELLGEEDFEKAVQTHNAFVTALINGARVEELDYAIDLIGLCFDGNPPERLLELQERRATLQPQQDGSEYHCGHSARKGGCSKPDCPNAKSQQGGKENE